MCVLIFNRTSVSNISHSTKNSVTCYHKCNLVFGGADRLCGLVVGVSGYRYRGVGFDSRRYQIFLVVVSLERVPLSLVRSIEKLLE